MRFSSTPRGARLARRLVSHRLDVWGYAYDSPANEALTLVAAELVANAVRHGRVPGRDFEVRLVATAGPVRLEVSDSRAERVPPLSPREPPGDTESGRGLMIVAAVADRWGIVPRTKGPGKTVWAECVL
nr:ATP-binding protein [Streptomyces triticiradicis]